MEEMTDEEVRRQLAEMASDEATDPEIPDQAPEADIEEEPEWQQQHP